MFNPFKILKNTSIARGLRIILPAFVVLPLIVANTLNYIQNKGRLLENEARILHSQLTSLVQKNEKEFNNIAQDSLLDTRGQKNQLKSLFEQNKSLSLLLEGEALQIISQKGIILFDSANAEVIGEKTENEKILFLLENKQDKKIETIAPLTESYDNQNRIYFIHQRIPASGWLIVLKSLKIHGNLNRILLVSLANIFAFLIAGILVSIILSRHITRPILNLSQFLQKILHAEGNLSKRALVESENEIGKLAEDINFFVDMIQVMVGEVIRVSQTIDNETILIKSETALLSGKSSDQAASFEEMAVLSKEIFSFAESVNKDSDDQMKDLKNLLERIKELSSSTNVVENRISGSLKQVEIVSENAKEGQESMVIMESSMEKIRDSSDQMTKIIAIINDISSRINLLALNASIEAARAGELGRGFAVVADEVSKLAEQTAESTKSIKRLIEINHSEISQEMLIVQKNVESSIKIIEGVGTLLNMLNAASKITHNQVDINNMVSKQATQLLDKTAEIKNSMQNQKTALAEVNSGINNLNETVQLTAQTANELAGHTEVLHKRTAFLRDKVAFFKVE
jgi:methyl-accepting chemotaxis protein